MSVTTEFFQMVRGMGKGEYFDFVRTNRIGNEVPVFTYHHVEEASFEAQLQHLRRNGYETLDSELMEASLDTGEALPEKSVLLTFDDGLEDLFTVAYPLLRTYGMRCIAFIAPFWIGETGVVEWPQILEMHDSGVVDFQAHSYSHGRIPVSSEIVDFFHPKHPYHQKWEVIRKNHDGESFTHNLPEWGMPIYSSASCLSGRERYMSDASAESRCIEYVLKNGGEDFFLDSQWRRKLYFFWQRQKTVIKQDYETMDEQINRIRREVNLPKKIIEERLPGKKVISFAYPYHERGEITDGLLQEQGYRWVFGGLSGTSCFGSNNWKFRCFKRVSGDFVLRLPGAGRISLLQLILAKGVRRLRGGLGY